MVGMDLTGKTALVTGASRGIGEAAAQRLAELGANVILTARTQDAAAAAAEKISGAVGFAAHATDEDAARRCVDFAIERFGRLDILINNAGTNSAYGLLTEQHYSAFRKTIDVNMWAPILWTSLAAQAWMSQHGGAIVNTASLGALTTEPKLGVYNATKAALIQLTKQSAVELAPSLFSPPMPQPGSPAKLWSSTEERSYESRG